VNWNHRVSGGSSQGAGVRAQVSGETFSGYAGRSLRNPAFAVLFLATILLATAAALFHFAAPAHASKAAQISTATPHLSSISLPMFFEPNQGQTDPRVKFLARGSGYGLFLTADEAVLEVQSRSKVETQLAVSRSANPPSGAGKLAAAGSKPEAPVTSIIRMHLEGANPAPKVAGSDLLPGKSNYFIGNDPANWRRDIPQYARVNYEAVYPGVDLVYYGNQGQLEYDFRIAAGADPGKIALKFDGASPRLEKGELVLSTLAGDVRFHAPNVYQQDGSKRRTVEAGFRRLADNVIGFQIGSYDHNRELVIDPTLFYSTWFGSGGESNVQVAVDQNGFNVYLAGSTTSATFPTVNAIQSTLKGTQNIFISQLNPTAAGNAQLVFSTYLGGSGTDTAAGVAVDSNAGSIYVAGTTTSSDFPHTPNAFQQAPEEAGTHGFLSKISLLLGQESLTYSTFISGNGTDTVTGLAIDHSNDAFLTGTTTSTDTVSNGFPATSNGFQTASNDVGATQFFASKINTGASGPSSMVYSTYFGGGYPAAPTTVGGGIAVDTSGNMYFTGASNFWGIAGPAGQPPFPLLAAQQTCLDQPGANANCTNPAPSALDAFVAKINPTLVGTGGLQYSTFLGGSGDDVGLAIAVDSASNAYITGETFSGDWNTPPTLTPFQAANNGSGDAFIAKLGNLTAGIYPITYFTYLGGSGEDIGHGIAVDSVSAAHVTGVTNSPDLLVLDQISDQPVYGGLGDAFVALILTTASGRPTNPPVGDYLTWLGGSGFDEGTGIALDNFNATYVAGDTQSGNFPTVNPYQPGLAGTRDAFVSKLTALSSFAYINNSPTVSPTPAEMGSQETFTFTWLNSGEAGNNVIFTGTLSGTGPGAGYTFDSATTTPGGACPTPGANGLLQCSIGAVPANSNLIVTVVLTPICQSQNQCPTALSVAPTLTANGLTTPFASASVAVDDFALTPSPSPGSQTVTAGNSTSYTVSLSACNSGGNCGPNSNGATYTNSISMSASVTPATSTITTSFTTTPVTISGSGPTTSTFNVSTQPRPVSSGNLWHRGPIYATWIPVGGLSLIGLGVGASRRRRRWIAGSLLGLIAGIVLLQPACGSSSSAPANTGGTPAGTYTIKITGSSGSDSKNAFVTLVVN
jgi:hypothetical protein